MFLSCFPYFVPRFLDRVPQSTENPNRPSSIVANASADIGSGSGPYRVQAHQRAAAAKDLRIEYQVEVSPTGVPASPLLRPPASVRVPGRIAYQHASEPYMRSVAPLGSPLGRVRLVARCGFQA